MDTKRIDIQSELEDIASRLDPSSVPPRIKFGGNYPKDLWDQGIYSYTDEEGGFHFTLQLGRPDGKPLESLEEDDDV